MKSAAKIALVFSSMRIPLRIVEKRIFSIAGNTLQSLKTRDREADPNHVRSVYLFCRWLGADFDQEWFSDQSAVEIPFPELASYIRKLPKAEKELLVSSYLNGDQPPQNYRDLPALAQVTTRGYDRNHVIGCLANPNLLIEISKEFGRSCYRAFVVSDQSLMPSFRPQDVLVFCASDQPKLELLAAVKNEDGDPVVGMLDYQDDGWYLSPIGNHGSRSTFLGATVEAIGYLVGMQRDSAKERLIRHSPNGLVL